MPGFQNYLLTLGEYNLLSSSTINKKAPKTGASKINVKFLLVAVQLGK